MTVRAILSDPDYPALKSYVLDHTGLTYYADKDEDLATRLLRRIGSLKVSGCSAYLAMLERPRPGAPEMDSLVGELTIGETYFFRQREHFELVRSTILPRLLRRNADVRRLRIWSAGCATGAEPHSIAILLQSEFAEQLRGWEILILGTDINPAFLAQAQSGDYSEWALRDVPPEARNRCFRAEGKRWILNREFRDAVTFRHHNLADGSVGPPAEGLPFDLILCRNVMIYFSEERTRAVVDRFFEWLAPRGWLLVGHAECTAEIYQRFEVVRRPDAIAFRKPLGGDPCTDSGPLPWQPWLPDAELPEIPAETTPAALDALSPLPAPPARLEEARTLADRGDWGTAAAICQSLLASDPLDAPAHFTFGLILAHTGSFDAAKAELRSAIYVDRGFALAYYHLGTLLQRAGAIAEARKAYRNVVQVLAACPADAPLEHGDGITAEELCELTRMHEEVLGE